MKGFGNEARAYYLECSDAEDALCAFESMEGCGACVVDIDDALNDPDKMLELAIRTKLDLVRPIIRCDRSFDTKKIIDEWSREDAGCFSA